MPLRLDIKRAFSTRSERVKGVDLHPTEPWVLANLYNGQVYVWNYNDQTMVKSFEVTEMPVRTAKFVARKQWVVTGADDFFVRVYNYNTMDKIKSFEAHSDYIRSIAVHPTLPYLLTSSDDMLIKLWDWDKGWACTQIFEGHSHYVMQVVFNPKDTNTFASASLDRTIKVWSVGSPVPNFTLEGHEKGVNCVDYFSGGDRPYLISGADDKLVKVWDYQTKACVQTLEGHSHNVAAVMFHPELPIILTGSEDGTVRIWHSTTYRLENTLNYGMERVWALSYVKGSNSVAIGYDEGLVQIKIGGDEPVASMDASGKIIWAKHNEIQTVNVKSLGDMEEPDGERLPLPVKDLGSCDVYPQSVAHNSNGRFVAVCGDGEYIVYTALAWRNKSFGSALEFVWGDDSSVFATRESSSLVKVHKNFKETNSIKPGFTIEGIHGGPVLALRGQDFVCFYDWNQCKCIRRIDVAARFIRWSDSGDLVAIVSDTSFFVLSFNRQLVEEVVESGAAMDEDGIDDAFELEHEIPETVRTGMWVGDCFVYTNSAWRLNYAVGSEVTTLAHLDRPMFLLGYLATQNRVYLMDKEFNVVPYTLLLQLVEYKTLVLRDNYEAAQEILPTIPKELWNSVAKFLESRGMLDEALAVAQDPDYRFDLAVQLGDLDTALEIAQSSDSESKWKQLVEFVLANGRLEVAEQCLIRAKDLSGMLLLYSSRGSTQGIASLAELAKSQGKHNVTFVCLLLLGQLDACVDLLIECGRLPEAAFFARTYLPSRMSECVTLWRKDLHKINPKAAESLADPGQYKNLFPNFDAALQVEQAERAGRGRPRPAGAYAQFAGSNLRDLIEEMGSMGLSAEPRLNGTAEVHHEYAAEAIETGGDAFASVGGDAAPPVDEPPVFVSAEPAAPPVAAAPPPPVAAATPPAAAEEEDDLLGLGDDDDLDLDEELADGEGVDLDDGWGLEDDEEEEK